MNPEDIQKTAKTYLDDVQNSPIASVITDVELENAGLVKIEAFVRTRTSAAAARKEKQRQADAEKGLKQLNVKVPEMSHEALKKIAAELNAGKSIDDAVKTVVTSHGIVTPQPATQPANHQPATQPANHQPAWKQFLINLLTNWLDKLSH